MDHSALIALALLVGDAEIPPHAPLSVRVAFSGWCVALEIDDHSQWWGWQWQAYSARGQYHALRMAPPLADARRLPPRDLIERWIATSDHARKLLATRASIVAHQREQIEYALWEDEARHDALDAMHTATNDGASVAGRRAALLRLRHRIGPHAYALGAWPRPIPMHLLPIVP